MVSKFQGVPDLPRDGGGVNNRPCARTTALPLGVRTADYYPAIVSFATKCI
jgi:hypothetical protein